jgi:hypothetical protein
MGTLMKYPDNRPVGFGGGMTTLDGSKTFVVTVRMRVTRVE